MRTSILTIFTALVIVFSALVTSMFVEALHGQTFLYFGGSFFLLSVLLFVLTLRSKLRGRLRKWLIVASGAAIGFIVCSVLHNLFYGIGTVTGHLFPISVLAEALHVYFFLVSILVCPIALLVGIIMTIVTLVRKRTK